MTQEGETLVEAFLIVEQPRQRLVHWSHALAPLDDPAAPPLALVRVYWDPAADQALLNLVYDPSVLGAHRLRHVVELALLAEIGMIQPAELSDGDRRRFLELRLARCTLRVDTQRNVVNTLAELVRQIRDVRSPSGRTALASIHPQSFATRRATPRGDTADPVLLVPSEPVLLVNAKGTRDDLPPHRASRERLLVPHLGSPPPPVVSAAATRDEVQHREDRTVSPHLVSRIHRAQTVEMPTVEVDRYVTESLSSPLPPPPHRGRARSPSEASTDRMIAAVPDPSPTNAMIYARYLRSGRWVPIRVGALSLKGAALMAGALPRMNDHVDVALSFSGHRALVRGNVGKISSVAEAALSGAASFSVNFELDDAARRQLTALLTAARTAKITIKPAPARAALRFPVDWAISLGTSKGVVRSKALDVSREGLFVRPLHALLMGSTVTFSSVLDDGAAPIAGRARVVRHVAEPDACTQGLSAGYGLHILSMGDADRVRWEAFLARVEKRADRRVLVGAAASRFPEIQAELVAAGYNVTGGAEPGALAQLASGDARPVDAVLIDAGWLSASASPAWVESLFSTRNVPCVTLHGDAKRARATIDRLLLVA